jgi:hypothetical protein
VGLGISPTATAISFDSQIMLTVIVMLVALAVIQLGGTAWPRV